METGDAERTAVFNFALFLDRLAAAAPLTLYAWGGCLLLAKILFPATPVDSSILAAAAGIFLMAMLIVDMARTGGGWFSRKYAAAWLDLRNHAGGKILSGDSAAIIAARIRPGISARHLFRRLALPALFAAAAALAPRPEAGWRVSGTGMERSFDRMERKIGQAVGQERLPEPDAGELRKNLRRLRDLAEQHPEAAAEALASIAERIETAANRRLNRHADALEKVLSAWRESEKAAAETEAVSAGMERRLLELRESLGNFVDGEGGMRNLPRDIQEALSGMPADSVPDTEMSRSRLRKILEALGKNGERLAEAASNPDGFLSAEEAASGSMRRLSRILAEMKTADAGGEPGSGGVDRGPGNAPLIFGDESRVAGERFAFAPLPAGEGMEPGILLERERAEIPENAGAGELQPLSRSGAAVSERIFSGGRAAPLGPERARVSEGYFRALGESRD
ncbi:MAG: hypothetical protein LBE84_12375 [Planctomycetota bacterium]|jgi:hypothetical protein|nr:hypothetical protein [Planctomycetota bacterium]